MQSIGLDASMENKDGNAKTDRLSGKLSCALLEYISASPFDGMDHVDYAVMVNGDWGTGKTYFIREFIKEVNAKEGQIAEQKERHQCIYYSLNGADSIDSIIDGILAKATGYGVAKKGADAFKGLGELLGGIPEVGKYAGLTNTVSNIVSSAVRR